MQGVPGDGAQQHLVVQAASRDLFRVDLGAELDAGEEACAGPDVLHQVVLGQWAAGVDEHRFELCRALHQVTPLGAELLERAR